MDYLERFAIPIKGMNIGVHEYQFSIENEFFNHFEDSYIKKGEYDVKLLVDRKERIIVLDFEIAGTYNSKCDRCLTNIDIPSVIDYKVYLKYGMVVDNKELDDVVYIDERDSSFNLSSIIHQMIILSLPMSNTYDCENDPNPKCDFEMLDYLENQNIIEENEKDTINPIWEKLKKDFNKN